jgi:hypothetical protein
MRRPIVFRTATKGSQVTENQVELFCRLCDDLIDAYSRNSERIRYSPEYERFVLGAYACGFVCSDFNSNGSVLGQAERDDWVERAPFITLRRYVHTLLRSERHSDIGEDWGGGNVYHALRSGVLQRVSARLKSAQEWRSSLD